MAVYLLKRLFIIIPTLLIVSMVTFILSRNVPNDSVLIILQNRGGTAFNEGGGIDLKQYDKIYKELERELPNFYFSILPSHYAHNINEISSPLDKELVKYLQSQGYASSKAIALLASMKSVTDKESLESINQFYITKDFALLDGVVSIKRKVSELIKSQQSFYYPKLHWYGANNQYHKWLKNLLVGDFGNSIINGRPVNIRIKKALTWTLVLSILTIIIGYLLGIIIGYYIALNPSGRMQKLLNQSLYLIYSIPVFGLATMLVKFLTTDDYGRWTNIFPSAEINIYPEASTMMQVLLNSHKLILPVICVSLLSISYIVRHVSRSMTNEMRQPYITTALSKGLTHKQVVRKHALPNALLPFITQLAGSFSTAIAGFLVIEVIFNIPGVGRLMYDSIREADWNVVFSIVMLVALATAISYLIGDIIYTLVNPKIKFA